MLWCIMYVCSFSSKIITLLQRILSEYNTLVIISILDMKLIFSTLPPDTRTIDWKDLKVPGTDFQVSPRPKVVHPSKFVITVFAWKNKDRREFSVATIIVCRNRKPYFWKSCICVHIFVNYLENIMVNIKMQLTNILYSKNGPLVINKKWVKCFSMVYQPWFKQVESLIWTGNM